MKAATNGAGVRPRIGALPLAIAAALGSLSSVALAQDQDEEQLEEITVTGSRIIRKDFTANSPITTLDAATFETTSTIGVETVLNQLPQFVPAVTQFTTTDVQQTATNTVGASTVSLRGLGPNRNLVLLNGRRAVPVDASMAVDTNTIPAAAIARVEVISGGASAVYGADAVGGVVNFVLKDDFEGATVDVKYGDSFDGGNQEITISALVGANVADDRGNVMFGIERSSRTLVQQWERDWRVENMANPSAPATAFFWGTDTWISINAFNAGPPGSLPAQAAVDGLFDQATPGGIPANGGVPNNVRMLVNRNSGTLYTGLMDAAGANGSYRYEGPFSGDPDGNFQGLPFRVVQPNGNIKENNFWQWSSIPLERLSAFASGVFDVSDSVRVTTQALISRNETKTSLGLTADNITFWGATIPFGNDPYLGNPAGGIPNPLNLDGTTNAAYLPGGRFGLNCEGAPSAAEPWNDGLPGCTQSEAWPVTPEIWDLYRQRGAGFEDANLWANRPPDYLRDALGVARSSTNTTTTMQLSLGAEGELPSGNDFWDITFSTGQTDNLAIQRGSTRLSTYRALMASPNYGQNAIFDPNPEIVGFAESIATCTSGLPIIDTRAVTSDCAVMLSPDLKNKREVTQSILEANLVGDLAEMPAGPLQYALGATYRENGYSFEPDNLSQNQNFIDPIAGLFPNEDSFGEFDVSEIYGELLIPLASGSAVGDFNLELGGRLSDWSMPQVDQVTTYKALIDWSMTPRYRLRGGYNRALRAPNLGELYSGRTQIFGGVPSVFGDQCSELNVAAPVGVGNPNISQAQRDQSRAICVAKMGTLGAQTYYIDNAAFQPTVGGVGIQNGTGNPNLREEAADTFTIGMVMDFHENWTLIVDYYSIEIEDMIAIESGDSVYQRCLGIGENSAGDPNTPACQLIFRNPSSGAAANIDLIYTNLGLAKMEGIDFQVNWSRMLANGGFNMNMVANYVLASETRDRPDLSTTDWAGTDGCSLQIECQGYDYRVFTTFNYFRGDWNFSLRHQFWPALDDGTCITAPTSPGCIYGGVQEDYQLFAVSASYTFNDKYTLRFGIENLLDEEPPCIDPNPLNAAYPIPCVRGQGFGFDAATYDPLGRRG
ncbi:MAG TPA: TonB-dependent receptor, partial [Gammaproteobacteria bacterium]|nr:TonB-dependent receptor [Gammaproteobacteria bacterium]